MVKCTKNLESCSYFSLGFILVFLAGLIQPLLEYFWGQEAPSFINQPALSLTFLLGKRKVHPTDSCESEPDLDSLGV